MAAWLASVLLAGLALTGCENRPAAAASASSSSGVENDTAAGPPVGGNGAQGVAAPPRVQACAGVRQAKRTFIGFAEGQKLDDFEATAREAAHLLRAIKGQLCRLDSERNRGLRAASLEGGGVEITAVRFTFADLRGADVEVQRVTSDAGVAAEPQALWTVRMQRTNTAWRVLSARRN